VRKAAAAASASPPSTPPATPQQAGTPRAYQARTCTAALLLPACSRAHGRTRCRTRSLVIGSLPPRSRPLTPPLTAHPPAQPRGLPEGEYYRSPRRSREGSLAGASPFARTPDGGASGSSAPPSPARARPGDGPPHGLRHLPSIPSVPDLTQPEAHDAWAAAVAAKEPWTQVEPWRTLWARSADAAVAEREASQGASAAAVAASAAAAAAAREAAEEARWAAVAARQELARRTALAVPSEAAASEAGAESPRSGWAGAGLSFLGPTRASASDEQTTQEVAAAMQSGNEAAAAERDVQERFINEHATRVRILAAIRR
jgi:hypothetical protein